MSDTPNLPPVPHALNCCCDPCCAARAAEVRRRAEDARREELRGRELALLESLGGVVFSRLGLAKAQPGTKQALDRRYGRVGR